MVHMLRTQGRSLTRLGAPLLLAGTALAACTTAAASQPARVALHGRGTPATPLKVTSASYPGRRFPATLLDRRYLDLSITCHGAGDLKLALPTRA